MLNKLIKPQCTTNLKTHIYTSCRHRIKYHFWNLIITSCTTLSEHGYTPCNSTWLSLHAIQSLNTSSTPHANNFINTMHTTTLKHHVWTTCTSLFLPQHVEQSLKLTSTHHAQQLSNTIFGIWPRHHAQHYQNTVTPYAEPLW